MKRTVMINRMMIAAFLFLLASALAHAQTDPSTALGPGPLASWNDGAAKKAIVEFVRTTTEKGGAKFVTPEARIAVFDNDGTTLVAAFASRYSTLRISRSYWTKVQYTALLIFGRQASACAILCVVGVLAR